MHHEQVDVLETLATFHREALILLIRDLIAEECVFCLRLLRERQIFEIQDLRTLA